MSETPSTETDPVIHPPEQPEVEKDPLSATLEELADTEKKEKTEKSIFILLLM